MAQTRWGMGQLHINVLVRDQMGVTLVTGTRLAGVFGQKPRGLHDESLSTEVEAIMIHTASVLV